MRACSESDRAFASELFYGVLRNLSLLDFWIGLLREGSWMKHRATFFGSGCINYSFCERQHMRPSMKQWRWREKRTRSLINAVLRTAQRRAE